MENYTPSHPVLSRFFASIPDYPRCTDSLKAGCRKCPKHYAIKRRYIEFNKPNYSRTYFLFDCDYPGADWAWYDLDLPAPTICVTNRSNKHAHLDYELSTPVHLGGNASKKAIYYADVIYIGFRRRLNADGSYGGLLSLNPLSDHWLVSVWNRTYELDELSESVREGNEKLKDLSLEEWEKRYWKECLIPVPGQKKKKIVAEVDPDESLFVYENTRWYGYSITPDCKTYGELYARIEAYIIQLIVEFNLDRSEGQIRSDATSITKFCWNHRSEFIASRQAFCEIQRQRAYRSHKARKRNNTTKIQKARTTLRKAGKVITKSAIAEEADISRRALSKRTLKTDVTEAQSIGAYKTADIKRAATEAKIKQVIDKFLREGRKITKSAIAKEAGISREAASRYYSHLFPKV